MAKTAVSSGRGLPLFDAGPPARDDVAWPVLGKGFRPFFLLAAAFAVAIVPLWLFVYAGGLGLHSAFDPVSWHAHELIFGFAVAVIAGFLLTAVGNWTRRETLVGWPLFALAALWLLGRVVLLAGSVVSPVVAAVVDLAFLPALAVVIARPLIATKNTRNFIMLAVLAVLWLANLAMHADGPGLLPGGRARGATVAVDVVVLLIVILAARIFPMFTKNATGVEHIASMPRLDTAAAVAMGAVVVADVVAAPTGIKGVLGAVAGALVVVRMAGWGTRHTLRQPMLWILHVGHLWIGVGLVLRGLDAIGLASAASSTHALTVGAIGALTLGMMVRVTLGHTGRLIVASGPTTVAFGAITLAAVVRVGVPWVDIGLHRLAVIVAGVAWTLAFAIFFATALPLWWRRRPDGKPG